MTMKLLKYICVLFSIGCSVSNAQTDTPYKRLPLAYKQYLDLVGKNNLQLAANQYNIKIAEAEIEVAKVFPNPSLVGGSSSYDISGKNMPQQWFGGIQQTIQLGGKRKARIDFASSQYELSKTLFNDFLRNLRADATHNYVDALTAQLVVDRKQKSYQTILQLADANEKLFKLGTIREVDVKQAKIEAKLLLNQVYLAEADLKASLLQLGKTLGKQDDDVLYYPTGNLNGKPQQYNVLQLIGTAIASRADILAAKQNVAVANKKLKLTKANRIIDVEVTLGNNYFTRSTNDIAPSPAYDSITGILSVPIPLSNIYKGDLKSAKYQIKQSELNYETVELTIRVEVRQNYARYELAKKQIEEYTQGLLSEAEKVLQGKIYSYQRGDASLLDVLNAQRTLNDVYLSYYDALKNHADTLIELQRSVGIWNIEF